MAYNGRSNLVIENAELIFRTNFAGEDDGYNSAHRRYFNVIIPNSDLVKQLEDDGWTVKTFVSKKDPDAEPIRYIKVNVRYDKFPPTVYTVCNGVKTLMTEDTVAMLDGYRNFLNIDLEINPSHWGPLRDGREGITAYLTTGYFEIEPDPFASKYATEESPAEDIEAPF